MALCIPWSVPTLRVSLPVSSSFGIFLCKYSIFFFHLHHTALLLEFVRWMFFLSFFLFFKFVLIRKTLFAILRSQVWIRQGLDGLQICSASLGYRVRPTHTAQNLLPSRGCRWEGRFNKCVPRTFTLPQTRCDDEHVPCCACSVCLIEEDQPMFELPFITSCAESQGRQWFALFFSFPALVPSIWAIAWLGCEVCLCVSPLSSL